MTGKDSFLQSLSEATALIKKHANTGEAVRILTHSDADGIAAGGIMGQALRRLGMPFKVSCEKRLDEELMKSVASESPHLVIFTDMGSGYLDIIEHYLSGTEKLVVDHHYPIDISPSNMVHINPMNHGLDGSREISGAGLAYLLARTLDPNNFDLSILGIVGALADQQDKGEKKTLFGLNAEIEAEAKKAELLKTFVDLIFFGYETRPLAKAIARTTSPFIPGLSGREDRAVAFLQEISIELKNQGRWRTLKDLSEQEKQNLFSELSKHLLSQGCGPELVHELIGTIYLFPKEEARTPLRDGREFASLLNACARMDRPSLGISICLGDRDKGFEEAERLFDDYRRKIAEYLEWVNLTGPIEERRNIYILKAGREIDDRIIGVVASILLSAGILKNKKPIIAVAKSDEGLVKISARADEDMASSGIDLGKAVMEAAEKASGRGGGHDTAAGAFLKEEENEKFLTAVDSIVGNQLRSKKSH